MRTKITSEVARVIKQSKRLRLKESYYHVKVCANQINLISDVESLRGEERKLAKASHGTQMLKLGTTNVYAMWIVPSDTESEIVAVCKNKPISNQFIIAEVYNLDAPLEGNLARLTIFQAFSALDALLLPNAENMFITIQSY